MNFEKSRLNAEPSMNLIFNIIQSYQKVEQELKRFLKPYGISLQQYNVLKILKGANKPLSTSIIRERMIQPMADSSRLVERLCAKGWVNRDACCTDRRLVDVTISDLGQEFLNTVTNIESVSENIYKKITPEEANLLNELLNKMRG